MKGEILGKREREMGGKGRHPMNGGSTVVSADTNEKTRAREGEEEKGNNAVIREGRSY